MFKLELTYGLQLWSTQFTIKVIPAWGDLLVNWGWYTFQIITCSHEIPVQCSTSEKTNKLEKHFLIICLNLLLIGSSNEVRRINQVGIAWWFHMHTEQCSLTGTDRERSVTTSEWSFHTCPKSYYNTPTLNNCLLAGTS